VSDQGELVLSLHDLRPPLSGGSLRISGSNISMVYRTGSFTPNFVRGISLTMMQLMFLAAVAVFTATFMSMPTAVFWTLATVPFSVGREFMADALAGARATGQSLADVQNWIYEAVTTLLPDFARTNPGEFLVDGLYISWSYLGMTALLTLLLRTGVLLALACLIFWKRELARVQV
jgi:hypothetical protein